MVPISSGFPFKTSTKLFQNLTTVLENWTVKSPPSCVPWCAVVEPQQEEGLLSDDDRDRGFPQLDPDPSSPPAHAQAAAPAALTRSLKSAREERSSIESVKTDEVRLLEGRLGFCSHFTPFTFHCENII